MPDLYFEDFKPGQIISFTAAKPVTKDAIIDFARQFDPQPFHLDEEAAKASMLGGLCASGWHTCAMVMRLNYDGWIFRTASMGAPGSTKCGGQGRFGPATACTCGSQFSMRVFRARALTWVSSP